MSRAKHAPPQAPEPPGARRREFLESDLAELLVLWPSLQEAIGRDSADPSSGGSRGGTGGVKGSPAPTNVDVLQAAAEIEAGCSSILAQVRRLLGGRAPSAWPRVQWRTEPDPELHGPVHRNCLDPSCVRIRGVVDLVPVFTVWVILDRLLMWHADLEREGQPLAGYICEDVARWRRSARTALRLSIRGPELERLCPDHRGTDPTRLRADRSEAELHPSILKGNTIAAAARQAPLTWKHASSVHCPHCKRRWTTTAQLAELGRSTQPTHPEEPMVDAQTTEYGS